MKRTSLIIISLLLVQIVQAKTRNIHIKTALEDAKLIHNIVVIGYTDTTLLCHFIDSNDTLRINSKSKTLAELSRKDNLKNGTISLESMVGVWPETGDTVLIVVNQNDQLELFAKLEEKKYRFWDPNSMPLASSVFWVKQEEPYLPLEDCGEYTTNDSNFPNYWICRDGCYILKSWIDQLINNFVTE